LRVVMDRLEVGDQLAELPQVVEDDLTATARYTFFTDSSVLQECEELTLDGVEAEALARAGIHSGARLGRVRDGPLQLRVRAPRGRSVPCFLEVRLSNPTNHEVEELARRFRLGGLEQVV